MMPGEGLAWLHACSVRWEQGGHQSSVLFNQKPSSISAGEHWTALVHRVSVTHEKKLGQFLMMLLIIGFCSVLNEKQVTQAISLKVGPLICACAHTYTPHTRKRGGGEGGGGGN